MTDSNKEVEALQEDKVQSQKGEKKKTSGIRNKSKNKIKELEGQIAELKDKNLRILAEFDNFRKRTANERIEMAKVAGQDIIVDLLPVLDDMDRAKQAFEENNNLEDLQNGFSLIMQKMEKILSSKGLKKMDAIGRDFDPEIHEAITEIPAPNKKMKGKVFDEVEKGYSLNDKIIRYAKVVVGK
jgi:molecular chaperone GrpE